MGETSFHFENPPDFQPNIDYRSLVEKGEIVSTKHLEGYWPISVVAFKTGESGLFRTTDDKLEAVVSRIDSTAQFGLVPSVAERIIEGTTGLVQHIPDNSQLAVFRSDWKNLIPEEELIKAAVFDFALNSRARTNLDILVNPDKKRIFLINNDSLMMLGYENIESSVLVSAVKEKGITSVPDKVLAGLQKVIDAEDKLKEGLSEKESAFVSGFVGRAKVLVASKTLNI